LRRMAGRELDRGGNPSSNPQLFSWFRETSP
jgi:hypothetical protein